MHCPTFFQLIIWWLLSSAETHSFSFFLLQHNTMLLFLSTMAIPTISRVNFFPKPSLFTSLRRIHLPHKHSTRSFSSVHNRTPKRDGDIVVLGIETSCDDTAAAIVSFHFSYFLVFFFLRYDFAYRLFYLFIFGLGEKWRWNFEPSDIFSGTCIQCVSNFVLLLQIGGWDFVIGPWKLRQQLYIIECK